MTANNPTLLPLSELTASGIRAFESLLANARAEWSADDVRSKSLNIAQNPELAAPLDPKKMVDITTTLDTRADVAAFVSDVLGEDAASYGPSSGHVKMWSWFSLILLHQLCEHKSPNKLEIGARPRYILSTHYDDHHRHLVAWPFWASQLHGTTARIFLCQKAYVQGDFTEQVGSRHDLITCRSVVETIDHLYWDEERHAPKVGAANRPDKGEPAIPGTLRALHQVLSQLACTYDLRSMNRDQILKKLPEEFGKYLSP